MQPGSIPELLVFLAAVATLVYSVSRDQWRSRRDLTIRLHEKWTDESYRKARQIAWTAFLECRAKQLEDHQGTKIPLSQIYQKQSGAEWAEHHMGTVEHFFDDLGRFAEIGALDSKVSKVAFLDIANIWFTVFSKIDWEYQDADWWEKSVLEHRKRLYQFWGEEFKPEMDRIDGWARHYKATRAEAKPSKSANT